MSDRKTFPANWQAQVDADRSGYVDIRDEQIIRLCAERDAARADAERLAATIRRYLDVYSTADIYEARIALAAALAAHDALTGDKQ